MCRYDDCDGTVTTLGKTEQKARVPHKCRECGRVINPGETYHVDRFVFDGEFVAHKVCAHCNVVREWLGAECGGWIYTEVAEDIRDHALNGYGWPVKRLAVGVANKWSTPSGRMMPVPALPLTSIELAQRAGATP